MIVLFGAVAQLEEHLLCKQEVGGSSPLRSTKGPVTWGNVSIVRSPICRISIEASS
jgi:hypothetical protein